MVPLIIGYSDSTHMLSLKHWYWTTNKTVDGMDNIDSMIYIKTLCHCAFLLEYRVLDFDIINVSCVDEQWNNQILLLNRD